MNPVPLMNLAAVAIVVALSAGGGWLARGVVADRDVAKLTSAHDKAVAVAAGKYAEAVDQIRAVEAGRRSNLEKEVHVAQQLAETHKRSADRAADATRRLREHIPRLVSAAASPGSDPETSVGSETAQGPGLVLTRLLDRGSERLRSCAAALDSSIAAGRTCERLYDSLSP